MIKKTQHQISYQRFITWVTKKPVWIVCILAILTGVLSSKLPHLTFDTSIYDIALSHEKETVYHHTFIKEFGSDDILLVVLKSDDIFSKPVFDLLSRLTHKIENLRGVGRVISLSKIKDQMDLTDRWDLKKFKTIVTQANIFDRFFVATDLKSTAITIFLRNNNPSQLLISQIQAILRQETKPHTSFLTGLPLIAKAIDDYSKKEFLILPLICFLVIVCLLCLLIPRLKIIIISTLCVATSLVMTLGLMAWTDTALSLTMLIIPVFLISVGIAYSMRIIFDFMPIMESDPSLKNTQAVIVCFTRIGFPIHLALMTTLIGIGSLWISDLTEIKMFCLWTCISLIWLLVVLFTLLPALLVMWVPAVSSPRIYRAIMAQMDRILKKISHMVLFSRKKTITVVLIISLFTITGIFQIKVESNLFRYFKKSTPIRNNFDYLNQHLGGSAPFNVVIDADSEDYFEYPENLEEITKIQDYIDNLPGVDKTLSIVDFIKLIHFATEKYNPDMYTVPQASYEVRMLINTYKSILGPDLLKRFINPKVSKVNIIVRSHIESTAELLATKKKIEAYIKKQFGENLTAKVTGLTMVLAHSSQLITQGQIKSILIALAFIFGILIILFLSLKVSFIALIPNCFPILFCFGFMGWFNIELSMVTSLIASIAIGLSVGNTIHFIVDYNKAFKTNLNKDTAISKTMISMGKPIFFTYMTIALGFSILLFSHFRPTAIFGFLMIFIQISALIGDLIILPSLLLHVRVVTAWDLLKLIPTLQGMSAGIAHELNQPLTAIKMGSDFLQLKIDLGQPIEDDQLKEVVEAMDSQIDRASAIVFRLNQFGQKFDFEKDLVDVGFCLTNVIDMLNHQFYIEGIATKTEIAKPLPKVLAHYNRLNQVFFNILANAIEAIVEKKSRPGSNTDYQGLIEVFVLTDRKRIEISITDNGIGIPKSMTERIFDPFVTTKTEKYKKGLGLPVCREILSDYNGKILIKNRKAGGTRVDIQIPI